MKVDLIIGTRPEFIKLAPVARIMRNYPGMQPRIILTGQHTDLLGGLPDFFDLEIHQALEVMSEGQTLGALTSKLLTGLEQQFTDDPPDVVVVQGDTSSAFMGALAAYYQKIPVCHVEAGLRTHDIYSPFPEEVNRAAIAQIAHVHFAPTQRALEALFAEGKLTAHLTGNTVIDAALFAQMRHRINAVELPVDLDPTKKLILVTAHRRESHESGLSNICSAIRTVHNNHPEVEFVLPLHSNPVVKEVISAALSNLERVHLTPPLSYPQMIAAMDQAWLLMTDSGGLQEEAPTFHLPVLVLREKSERMEAVESGSALLCGTVSRKLVEEVERLLEDKEAYKAMALVANPFGDGKAAMRITEIIKHTFKTPTQAL